MKKIYEVTPVSMDLFSEVLNNIGDGPVIVNDSVLVKSWKSSIIVANMENVFNESFNMEIGNSKTYASLFKLASSITNDKIEIYDDPENSRYVVKSGKLEVYVYKIIDEVEKEMGDFDRNSIKIITEPSRIDQTTTKTINKLMKGSKAKIAVKGDKILSLIFDKGSLNFTNGKKNMEPDLELISTQLLSIPSDTYEIMVGKDDSKYWLITSCTLKNVIDVIQYEVLTEETNDFIV